VSLFITTTFLLSVEYALVSVAFKENLILIALGAWVVVLIATPFTPFDITGRGIYLFVAVLGVLCAFLIIGLTIGLSDANRKTGRVVTIVLVVLSVVILPLLATRDAQLIVRGQKRRFQLGEDDWLVAGLKFVTDIEQIFFCFLLSSPIYRDYGHTHNVN